VVNVKTLRAELLAKSFYCHANICNFEAWRNNSQSDLGVTATLVSLVSPRTDNFAAVCNLSFNISSKGTFPHYQNVFDFEKFSLDSDDALLEAMAPWLKHEVRLHHSLFLSGLSDQNTFWLQVLMRIMAEIGNVIRQMNNHDASWPLAQIHDDLSQVWFRANRDSGVFPP